MTATINGSLRTWFGGNLADREPLVRFVPSGAAAERPDGRTGTIKDVSSFDESGAFTVELEPMLRPQPWYELEVYLHTAEGSPVRVDFPEMRIHAPDAGTYDFSEVADGFSDPVMVWVSLESPDIASDIVPGVEYWRETNPNNIEDPLNTGFLRKRRQS